MKKLTLLILLLLLTFPATGDAAYIIHLKNGGQFTAFAYWRDGNDIKFYVLGGTVGISKDSVRKIEKTAPEITEETISNSKQETAKASSEISSEPANPEDKVVEAKEDLKAVKEEEKKIDIAYYKGKKSELETQMKEALEKVREADKNKDSLARERAMAEAQEIRAKMYALTAELAEKNDGKMPEEWWEK